MTADVLNHVFEPFFTTKPAGKGTGLGLSTVYGIVRQSRGQIIIDSAPGHGTAVTVHFQSSGQAPLEERENTTAALKGGTETILIVEDEISVRDLMTRTLKEAGYIVLTAQSAADAITVAMSHHQHIDLVVSDVVMPGFSGPDVVQRIVRLNPELKVLYVSGFTSQMALDSGTLSRRTAFLAKPFAPHGLIKKVRECLDVRS
jgi:CheY-like chemotaxis protein